MRSRLTLVCALILVAACGRVPSAPISSGDYKLYEAVSDRSQIAVIDSQSHAIERWLQLGTPSSDWKHLYSVAGAALVDIDPQTGAAVRSLNLPGHFQLPPSTLSGMPGGLSQNGQWIVLESFDNTPTNGQPSASHFLVVNTSLHSTPVRIDMKGYFEFDAISNDGGNLYVIEYVSANAYRVRIYEVSAQQLNPQVVVDKSNPTDSMTGLRLSGIPSQDGAYLYSIYVRQTGSPFIHALNTKGNPIAFCIDLPGSGYQSSDNAFQWSLAMSSDGSHLYATNAATGAVSELNISDASPDLARTVQVDSGRAVAGLFAQDVQAKEFGANGAVISPDGKTLVTLASSGIVWVDTSNLRARTHALTNWNVWSLALSPDGKLLYALSDSGKIAEVSMDSGKVNATFDPGARNPMALMRVVAA
jgi:WD40 repeat protein